MVLIVYDAVMLLRWGGCYEWGVIYKLQVISCVVYSTIVLRGDAA